MNRRELLKGAIALPILAAVPAIAEAAVEETGFKPYIPIEFSFASQEVWDNAYRMDSFMRARDTVFGGGATFEEVFDPRIYKDHLTGEVHVVFHTSRSMAQIIGRPAFPLRFGYAAYKIRNLETGQVYKGRYATT